MKIYKWYKEKEDESKDNILKELLHYKKNTEKNKECLINCKEWLKWFGEKEDGWHHFVDTLFMQDYVDNDYEVIPFWDEHSWEKPKLMDDLKDEKNNTVIISKIDKRLEEINRRIVARSNRIVDACKAKLKEEGDTI